MTADLCQYSAIDPAAVIFTMTGQDGGEDHNEVARMLGGGTGVQEAGASG